jgi:DNA-binding transcriptional LysR family regulator
MSRQFDDGPLGAIELFCLAAELGSFTAAALQAGVTPGAISRSVSRIEARLGVRLFVRTTRQIRLTDAGQVYFAQCRQALGQIVEAERLVTGQQAELTGVLRVSMPSTYGQHRILPLMPGFRQLYPQVRLDLHLSNRNIDFASEQFDLAIRARTPADSTLVARKLEDAPLLVVAAPAYLARAGVPQTLADLAQHECVQFIRPTSGRSSEWLFRDAGRDVEVATTGSVSCADELYGGVQLARCGAGLYQAYRFMVERELQSGELVEVLQNHAGRTRPFSVIYPHSRHLPARVRALVDYLLAGVQQAAV